MSDNKDPDAIAEAIIGQVEVLRDTALERRGMRRGNKIQISLTLDPGLLSRADELADRHSLSRAAMVTLLLTRAVEAGVL